jgi:hypothetical protein
VTSSNSYPYQDNVPGIPPIPILTLQLFTPNKSKGLKIPCPAIIDTGADCSLLPLKLLMQAQAKPTQGAGRVPVCGIEALAVPVEIGLVFGGFILPTFQLYGCSDDDIGDMGIIGRDLLNLYCVEFDGRSQTFSIK